MTDNKYKALQERLENFLITLNDSEEADISTLKNDITIEFNKLFPNVEFSLNDAYLLSRDVQNMNTHQAAIHRIKSVQISEQYGGRKVDDSELSELRSATSQSEKLDKEHADKISSFFHVCETLNNPSTMQDPTVDLEGNIFKKMHEYGFSLKPKNPVLRAFYETYLEKEKFKASDSEKTTELAAAKTELKEAGQKIQNMGETITVLATSKDRLQKMLSATLAFCEHVKHSRFGKFFFGKQLKQLPEKTNPTDLEEI